MSSEGRPRRTARATTKTPVELMSTASNSGPSHDPTSSTSRTDDDTKRGLAPEDEAHVMDIDETKNLQSSKDVTAKTNGKAKGRTDRQKEKLYDIDFILTNPKSLLVNINISDILNYGVWMSLSPESRANLCKLLPATALGAQIQTLDEFHPSRRPLESEPSGLNKGYDTFQVHDALPSAPDPNDSSLLGEQSFDPSFFKDPHFESAARTFQDHLYSGWFAPAHHELVEKHLSGIRDGSLHAPWKDDVWERGNPEVNEGMLAADDVGQEPSNSIGVRREGRRGKETKASEFDPLVRKGFLKQGDIITLRHKFVSLGITVEKDALISDISPKTSILTLTTSSGTTQKLPPALLAPNTTGPVDSNALRVMTVSNPMQLITALLDIDGRIPRDQRPRLYNWKVLSAWQWPPDADVSHEEATLLERGGRIPLGTLFYLRGQALDD